MNFGRTEWSQFLFRLKLESQPQEGADAAGTGRTLFQPLTETQTSSHALSSLADFTFHGNSAGGCFAGTLATQRKQFSLLTALLFPEKQKVTTNLPLPMVAPQANTNLSPRTGAVGTLMRSFCW